MRIKSDRSSGREGHRRSSGAFAAGLGLLVVVVALAVLLVGSGLALGWFQRPAPPAGAAERTETIEEPVYTEPPTRSGTAATPAPSRTVARAHPAKGVPERLLVPELGVDAPVLRIDAPGGVLLPPDDPQTLGWWQSGARPGARLGSALVTGHTVNAGGGALDDLETLAAGDVARVRTSKGMIGYQVRDVRIYRKASLAQHAARVFSQTVPGRLVLITCEDWNGSKYLSNVVVIADPVS